MLIAIIRSHGNLSRHQRASHENRHRRRVVVAFPLGHDINLIHSKFQIRLGFCGKRHSPIFIIDICIIMRNYGRDDLRLSHHIVKIEIDLLYGVPHNHILRIIFCNSQVSGVVICKYEGSTRNIERIVFPREHANLIVPRVRENLTNGSRDCD